MSSARPFVAVGLVGLLAALPLAASAQQVYRIVGPDGRVTFSDRPPPDAAGKAAAAPSLPLPASAEPAPNLPFELRAVTSKYPVILYGRPGCAPCDNGRAYLTGRGVPFSEKSVTTQDDLEALQRITGTLSLPVVSIGAQQLKGYSQLEWSQFLDAAGYPKTSQLPSAYRYGAATPLVAAAPAQPAPAATQQAADEPQRPAPLAPTGPGPSNPAGIQF